MDPMRARQLIETLQLQPHPEGGWFREVFRSTAQVVPADGRPARQALTTIYFLLEAHQHSRWHTVRSDEVWIHLEGVPLALWTCDAALRTAPAHVRLGPVDVHGTRPQHTVPAGQWQAARPIATKPSDDYTLVGCTVGPGFDFTDFSFMRPDSDEAALLRHHWPDLAALI
ncbi:MULTISPECIES: cupin domain-containing protein [unclassified Variovorax]|uniref:cupin domain-containing protein n=1 Tax=unclassified Variovorax TaxID=663243 RepID=UPI0013A5B059|nr:MULTISPECIES: cupin domain-containing protein [unclassified Variovorax]